MEGDWTAPARIDGDTKRRLGCSGNAKRNVEIVAATEVKSYAAPGKYTKGFRFENTWALLFLPTMFVVPAITTAILVQGVTRILTAVEGWRLATMVAASFLLGNRRDDVGQSN